MDSPFEVLSVDPDADQEEIDRAYRRRVKEAHPDLGGSAAEFRAVRAAYEAVSAGDGGARKGAGSRDGTPTPGRDGRDPDPAPGPDRDARAGAADEPLRREAARVEYLDYGHLRTLGWDLGDGDPFESTTLGGLDPAAGGRIEARPDEPVLEAAEEAGLTWPYSCRGGACANCAVAVLDGEIEMPVDHILPEELLDRGIRLSCVGTPATDELRLVCDLTDMPALDDLRLPPRQS